MIPRPEYPRPILVRDAWLNLNGEWSFAQDPANQGLRERWFESHQWAHTIVVPYPVEAAASGIQETRPAQVVWYETTFEVPPDWQDRVMLRIGACDHWTRIFLNGLEVGQHRGGYAPIVADLTHALVNGANRLTLRVEDSLSWTQPRGKQAGTMRWPIDYDSVTGIWQTVWLEPLPAVSIEEVSNRFSLSSAELIFHVGLSRHWHGDVEVILLNEGNVVARAQSGADGRAEARITLNIPDPELWSPANPRLYDVAISLADTDGKRVDSVVSYVGLREITAENGRLCLNGEPIYLRGILDQGYFPDGWYTAVDDHAIREDVALTLAMGFNCARKHQKAEDPRYLYWADRLGLMVWSEMPSGRIFSTELVTALTDEWIRLVRRDRGHPCIVAWVPFNESWGVWNQADRPEQRAFVDGIAGLTRSLDPSRPIVGNDGWEYSSGDLWTLHIYEDEAGSLKGRLDAVLQDPSAPLNPTGSVLGQRVGALPGADVSGLPVLLTECGGIGFISGSDKSGDEFAYGDLPTSVAELEMRFRTIGKSIDEAESLAGFVWTQLTDIQQEINGVLYFDRRPKLPLPVLYEIFSGIGPS